MHRIHLAVIAVFIVLATAPPRASAQGFGSTPAKPRPWSRVSFYTNSSRTEVVGGAARVFTELSTAFSYQLPDVDDDGVDYGMDVRYATSRSGRPARTSIYEAFIGGRLMRGKLRVRAGQLYYADVGALGQVAGGAVEYRQPRGGPEQGRIRVGAFGGVEPNVLDTGYASGVRKVGAFVAYDGAGGQRDSVGYVLIRNGALTERSVLTTTNFLSMRRTLYVYQAAEIDLTAPAGVGSGGLAYFFGNVRATPNDRLELQGTYNRGRSVDARGLGDDVINGRPIPQSAIDGLLFESAGGRVTVEVVPRVRVYAGVSRDKNNRDTAATRRFLVGGYAANVARTGLDITASDSLMNRATGSYHSFYLSVGRQTGRIAYLSGDYSTSLSVIRFSQSDGIVIESRPHTSRISGTLTVNLNRAWSLMGMLEHTSETGFGEVRALTGLTYRIR